MTWIHVFALLICSKALFSNPLRVTASDRWNHYVNPYYNLPGVHLNSPEQGSQTKETWNIDDLSNGSKYIKLKGPVKNAGVEGNFINQPKPEGKHRLVTGKDTSLRRNSQLPQSDMAYDSESAPTGFHPDALVFSRYPLGYPYADREPPAMPSFYFDQQFPGATGSQPHDMVWNEKGQYWGYSQKPPKFLSSAPGKPIGDSLYWPYDSQPELINQPECIPPFCIPINCDSGKCKPATSVTVSCMGSDCDFPCDRSPNGSRRCPQNDPPCRSGRFGDKCHLLHPVLCRQSHALDCRYGCGGTGGSGTVILCLCDPWTQNRTGKACLPTEKQLFTCPLDCTGRGQCEPATKTCNCNSGFHGLACEQSTVSPAPTTSPECPTGLTGADCRLDVDECLSGNNNCEQRCVNTYGSFLCQCHEGYRVSPQDPSRCLAVVARPSCHEKCVPGRGKCVNGVRCLCQNGFEGEFCEHDVDECATGRHRCQQVCVNTPGSYSCQCHPGYRVDERNPYSCQPIGCNPPCVESQGRCSPQGKCECRTGYIGVDCGQDVDECATGRHNCEQLCVNLPGTYRCNCDLGYTADPDRGGHCLTAGTCDPRCSNTTTTSDQNKCRGKQCLNGGSCRLIGSRHECTCPNGFQGRQCQADVDECAAPHGLGYTRCQHTCVSTPGSYKCTCRPGYQLQADSHSCMREPAGEGACPGGCLNGGVCITLLGRCECPRDFRGSRCELRVEKRCKSLTRCEYDCLDNPDGSSQCICPNGFTLKPDGQSCGRSDACPSQCLNGGYCFQGRCFCTTGFEGDACELDRNECIDPVTAQVCTYKCNNTFGSFECLCPEGYRRLEDLRTCVIDEPVSNCDPPCKNGGVCTGKNHCECLRGFEGEDCSLDVDECSRFAPCDTTRGECVNRPGWYECVCKSGYRLTVDGHQCIEAWRAQENPSLVFRGRGQKGIVMANPVTPGPNRAQVVVSFSSQRLRRRSRRRAVSVPPEKRWLVNSSVAARLSPLAGRRRPVLRSFQSVRLGDPGVKRRSVVVLNSKTLPLH